MANGTGVSTPDVALMASKVAADPGLDTRVRKKAADLLPIAHSNPALARQLLIELSDDVRPLLPRIAPSADLCRTVPLLAYFRYHMDADARAFYLSEEEYSEHLQSLHAGTALLADLSYDEPLFRAVHSWLVPCGMIAALSGRDLKRALGLRSDPPFVVFELSRTAMLRAGVTVRPARSVDAVPSWFTEWDPNGLPTGLPELVDGDVPRSALSSIRWIP